MELEITLMVLFDLFETQSYSAGMTKVVPGGATITAGAMPMQKRHLTLDAAPLLTIVIEFGRDVAVGVFASWLYDKLKRAKRTRVRINRRIVEVSEDAILKVVEETIEIERK